MKLKYLGKIPVWTALHGDIEPGQVVEVPEEQAEGYRQNVEFEELSAKAKKENSDG